ncbi:MAG TPA: DUF1223 domain-containing protein [Hyphomonadaceae bacterium]|nr:DUF1223 domain-containing protein [Hyphomonadaceae bacterium]
MKSLGIRLFCAALAIAAAPAASGQKGGMNVPEHAIRPVVMELFSSQGCGNCPKANENIRTLSERSDVIALTYPVGIWDYLGWDDTFAKPEFAERQKRYNRVLKHRGPYTPQVVYSGRLHGSGTNMKGLEEKFAIRDISPYPASIVFESEGITVSGALPEKTQKAGVILVRYRPGETKVTPGAGANKGKAMTYFNLVTSFEPLGEWTGGDQKFAAKNCTAGKGCVVLVQKDGMEGLIIGAAQKK